MFNPASFGVESIIQDMFWIYDEEIGFPVILTNDVIIEYRNRTIHYVTLFGPKWPKLELIAEKLNLDIDGITLVNYFNMFELAITTSCTIE